MYFPKSQITPNLYTNGREFVNSLTKEGYTGFYFKTSSGRFFTGKNQDDRPNIELIKIEPLTPSKTPQQENNVVFYSFTDNPNSLTSSPLIYEETLKYALLKDINIYNPPVVITPSYSPTLPTSQDYQNGEFQRYFCKKTNEIKYIEINKEQFDKLIAQDPQIEFSLYQPFTITWIISGDKDTVAKTNRNIVELASFRQKLPRLADYLRFDYTKYLK
jgi:hypothetical protein